MDSKQSSNEQIRAAVQNAIGGLPKHESCVYFEALKKAPHLIESESNPRWFLVGENGDVWKAAKKLAFYWKRRKDIFEKRAFLPLAITGDGALCKETIERFSTAHIAFLPHDKDGRTVLFKDHSRLKGTEHEIRVILELLFYHSLIFMQNENNMKTGIRVIWLLKSITVNEYIPIVQELMTKAIPIRVHCMHLIPTDCPATMLDKIMPWILRTAGHLLKQKIVHTPPDSNQTLVQELEKHGLTRSGLPDSIGGQWSYMRHLDWMEQRLRMEWGLPLTETFDAMPSNYVAKPASELTEDERLQRRRHFSVLHSRRKRQRDRFESNELKEEINGLEHVNIHLQTENKRLKRLTEECHKIIHDIETGSPVNDSLHPVKKISHVQEGDSFPKQPPSVTSHGHGQHPGQLKSGKISEGTVARQQVNLRDASEPQDSQHIDNAQRTENSVINSSLLDGLLASMQSSNSVQIHQKFPPPASMDNFSSHVESKNQGIPNSNAQVGPSSQQTLQAPQPQATAHGSFQSNPAEAVAADRSLPALLPLDKRKPPPLGNQVQHAPANATTTGASRREAELGDLVLTLQQQLQPHQAQNLVAQPAPETTYQAASTLNTTDDHGDSKLPAVSPRHSQQRTPLSVPKPDESVGPHMDNRTLGMLLALKQQASQDPNPEVSHPQVATRTASTSRLLEVLRQQQKPPAIQLLPDAANPRQNAQDLMLQLNQPVNSHLLQAFLADSEQSRRPQPALLQAEQPATANAENISQLLSFLQPQNSQHSISLAAARPSCPPQPTQQTASLDSSSLEQLLSLLRQQPNRQETINPAQQPNMFSSQLLPPTAAAALSQASAVLHGNGGIQNAGALALAQNLQNELVVRQHLQHQLSEPPQPHSAQQLQSALELILRLAGLGS